MKALIALNNAVLNSNIEGLQLHEKHQEDKRKTVKTYFLTFYGTSISPCLDYENMNHFILGVTKGFKLQQHETEQI